MLRLFQTSRRFGIEIQPQLVLLQKTLLNVEGLWLQLDPDLDLWKTAKPWLERWMSEQVGWRGFIKALRAEAPRYATLLPQLPRLLHQRLTESPAPQIEGLLLEIVANQRQRNFFLMVIAVASAAAAATLLYGTF